MTTTLLAAQPLAPAHPAPSPPTATPVIAFLGSHDASYVSGQVIWPDGGYAAGVAAGQFENVTGNVA